ncbi:hypothetical protein GCM10022415_15870 [Knoellia locipacati]|uniref:Uncharacterized protein n=1 Tax=Knoellia locipacati TaxID=882824 RepID=A0A512SZY8_9MICO|nr:hypothetical protein KLO01_15840 [Knoellia locipacati]
MLMSQTTAPKRPATQRRGVGVLQRAAGVAALVAGSCVSILLALSGWFLGAAPLTAVEPNGLFVDCGPALFDRPNPLPDAACASAYFPLPVVSVLFLVVGTLGALSCLGLLARRDLSNLP